MAGKSRVFILSTGPAALGVGMAVLATGMIWGPINVYMGAFVGLLMLALGVPGVIWWLQVAHDQVVEEASPRTVQYVYMTPAPKPECRWSTTYTPRQHPTDDALAMDLMRDLTSDTGDLSAYRGG